jgi:hypothetical protein
LIKKIGYAPTDPEKELDTFKEFEKRFNELVSLSSRIEELKKGGKRKGK